MTHANFGAPQGVPQPNGALPPHAAQGVAGGPYAGQYPANAVNGYQNMALQANVKNINKHIFTWVGAFLFGCFGVDRFLRGQIGLGIVKLIFGWLTCGIWWLVDWIVAISKSYGNSFANTEELIFVNGKYAR